MAREISSDQTVVSIAKFRERTQQGALSLIESYWESLRNGRVVPARSEIDPRKISGALEHAFIIERVAKGLGRFRLAGAHLNDLMGMEVRGMPLTAMIAPDSRQSVTDALETVFDEPATARFHLTAERSLGKPAMDAQLLILPLRSDLGDVSRALGAFVATGKIGRAPRRFNVVTHSLRTMLGKGDPRCATTLKPEGPETLLQGFGEDAKTRFAQRVKESDRPRLHLIDTEE